MKAKVNFKIYDFINWEQIIKINKLPNISRGNDNQAMKSGQLIICGGEYLYLKIMQRIREEKLAPDLSLFFK